MLSIDFIAGLRALISNWILVQQTETNRLLKSSKHTIL